VVIYLQKQIRYEIEELSPTLDIENFGLSSADLGIVFDAARVIGLHLALFQKLSDT
jgi:hypothetical protein